MKIKNMQKMVGPSFHRSTSIEHVEQDSEAEFGGDSGSNSECIGDLEQEKEAMPSEESTTPCMDHIRNVVEDSSNSSSQSPPSPKSPTSVLDMIGAQASSPSSSSPKKPRTSPMRKAKSTGSLFVDDNNNDKYNSKDPRSSSNQGGKDNSSTSNPDGKLRKAPSSSPRESSLRNSGGSIEKSKSLVDSCLEESGRTGQELQSKSSRTRSMGRKPKSMRNLARNRNDDGQQSKEEETSLSSPSRSGKQRCDGMKVKSNSSRALKCLSSGKDDLAEASAGNNSTRVHSGRYKLVVRQKWNGSMRKAKSMRSLIGSSSEDERNKPKKCPNPGLCRSSSLTGPLPPQNETSKFRRVKSFSTETHNTIIKVDGDEGNDDDDITRAHSSLPSVISSSRKKRDFLKRKSKSVRGLRCSSSQTADDVPLDSSLIQKIKRDRAVAMKKAKSMRALTVTDEGDLAAARKSLPDNVFPRGERRSSDPVPREKSDNNGFSRPDKKKSTYSATSSNRSSRRTEKEARRKAYRRSKSMNMTVSCDKAAKTRRDTPKKPQSCSTMACGDNAPVISRPGADSAPSNVAPGEAKQVKSQSSRGGKAHRDGSAGQDLAKRRGSSSSREKSEDKNATPPLRRRRPSLASPLGEDEGSMKETDVVLRKCSTDPNIRHQHHKRPVRAVRSGGKGVQKSFSSNSGGHTSNSDNHRPRKGLKDVRNRLGQPSHTSQMIPSHQGSNQSVTSCSCSGGSISSLTMSSRLYTQDDFSISSSQKSPFRRALSSPHLFADASIEEDDEMETSCGDLEEHPIPSRWDAHPRRNSSTDTVPVAPDHDLSTVGKASAALRESHRSSYARWSTETRNGSGSIRKKLEADSKPVQPNHDTSSYCGSAVQPWDGSDVHVPATSSYSVTSSYAGMISELTPGTYMGDSSCDRHEPIKSRLQAKFQRDKEKRNLSSFTSTLSGSPLHSEQIHLAVGSHGSANKKRDGAPRMVRRHSLESVSHSSFCYNDQGIVLHESGLASHLADEIENDNAPKIPSRRTSTGSSVYYVPSDSQVAANRQR